jgi:carboxypeptidase PM20D1
MDGSPEDRFLDHLQAAVRFATVSHDHEPADPATLAELRRFLESTYPKTWSTLSVELISESALLLTWAGTDPDQPGLLLAAHQDVVPIESPDAWDHSPFAAVRDATHLHGRGVLDDKGPLIAILETVEGLIESDFRPTATLVLAFGHDEERLGRHGAGRMSRILEDRGVHVRLVLDEGGLVTEAMLPGVAKPVAVVAIGEKGYADIELTATGERGHSSAPPSTTAVGRIATAVAAVERKQMPARLDVVERLFTAISPAARPGLGPVLGALPKLGPLAKRALGTRATTNALIRTTITPTMLAGGTKANVLPTSARAVLNCRIMPGDTLRDVVSHIEGVVGEGIRVNVISGHDPPPLSDPQSDAFAAVAGVAGEVFPDAVVAPFVVMVATDARFYTGIADQVLRFQPFRMNEGEFRGIHGPNERMRLSDAGPALRFYRRLIEQICG